MYKFNGLSSDMKALTKLSNAKSRSISPENPTGEVGKGAMMDIDEGGAGEVAKDLGKGWKINPWFRIQAKETFEIANIEGPGAIQQIWMTGTGVFRHSILRIYWDHQEHPSVEVPLADFFCSGWNEYSQLSSLAVCVNPGIAFNSYWIMPFKKHCRMTIENLDDDSIVLFYQINYALTEIDDDEAYFHAQFRRVNPVKEKEVYTIVDGIEGKGHYVGTYVAWGVNHNGWWGEGELKFYLDDDLEYPTICGTGTEDYFCGSYNFENKKTGQYQEFTTPYAGFHQVIKPDGLYQSQQRFGMYRWHITDPIRFDKKLRVTMQVLGWRRGFKYHARQDDVASVAFWYQTLPTKKFPPFYDIEYLEVI